MSELWIPPRKDENTRKSHGTDRLWDTTRKLCQELADQWNMTKVATYDLAIRVASHFDTPEELAALAAALSPERLGQAGETMEGMNG